MNIYSFTDLIFFIDLVWQLFVKILIKMILNI
jgi:hypothetical protein